MPLNVRIKVALSIFLGIALLAALFNFQMWAGVVGLVIGISYLEMIYPKWNFYVPAILNVKNRAAGHQKKAVAITFDDGPSEWTLKILETLKKENIKATFFLLGKNVERHPEIARRVEGEGHTIGYHGYSHTKFHFKSAVFIKDDLNLCVAAFERAGLRPKNLVRFPHGVKNIFSVREIKRRGWTLCGWGRGVWDSKKPGVDLIVKRSSKLHSGEILLLHDGDGAKENPDRSQTAEALPKIIQGLKSKGFEFVTL